MKTSGEGKFTRIPQIPPVVKTDPLQILRSIYRLYLDARLEDDLLNGIFFILYICGNAYGFAPLLTTKQASGRSQIGFPCFCVI